MGNCFTGSSSTHPFVQCRSRLPLRIGDWLEGMSRSFELGRAVLGSPTSDHELWLTTLITILPEQNATYLQQLKAGQCLEMLASGRLWVGRGHGMHIDLKITVREEALPPHKLAELAEAICQAPIWNQLMLKPTLLLNNAFEPGTVHLDIIHATTGLQEEQKRHRLFPDVPAADTRPPIGVTTVCLQSVSLSIDILEMSPRRKVTAKRSDTHPGDRRISSTQAQDSLQKGATPHPTTIRKRKRPITETGSTMQQVPVNNSRRYIDNTPWSAIDSSSTRINLYDMVNASLRLTICGTLNKTGNVSKIKASTFRFGLADVAPSVWRIGYLTALSQRAHLLPTIARSLHQVGYERTVSLSLRDKLMNMSATSGKAKHGDEDGIKSITDWHGTQTRESIASQLWIHSQTSLLRKPSTSLQACVAFHTPPAMPGSDDMLADEEQTWSLHVPGTPSDDTGLLDSNQVQVDGPFFRPRQSPSSAAAQKIQQHEQPFSHADMYDDPGEAEDDLLLDSQPHNAMSLMDYPSDGKITSTFSLPDGSKPQVTALAQQPAIRQAQCSLGRIGAAGFSSSPGRSSEMGNVRVLPDKAPVIGESGDHNIDCGDEILLVF
ncbi:hypothetical protein Ptr902_04284 [Pyrenophora tritici-repentis]|nr:hypothetical protein Ptr902_04284 [Pyrenophora tritici-repentis]